MQGFLDFFLAHKEVFIGLGVAIVDLVFALVPSLKSNGILHMILMWLGLVKE